MSSTAILRPETAPIVACTISRNVQKFDLLIEDMDAVLGESWGDLSFAEALSFLDQPDAAALDFVAIALDAEDEADLELVSSIVSTAKASGIKVVLITEDVSPTTLHKLLREGGSEFIPYPLPEGELGRAIDRLRSPSVAEPAEGHRTTIKPRDDRSGVIVAVHGLAGGTGATMLAVNLAWELALADKQTPPRVALLDLDLQNGAVATYLDLPRREAVLEMLSQTESLDSESLLQAMLTFEEKVQVLTAPADLVPLDLVGPADIKRLLQLARVNFDYVVIDMPKTMGLWTETVITAAHVYLATLELDMRSAQNTLRLKRAMQSEDLPFEKFRFVLNRAPGFTDLNGKGRVKRLSESLGISIEVQLPDGGKAVTQAGDQGSPLAMVQPKSAVRKEIAKLAMSIHAVNVAAEARGERKQR